MRWFLPLCVLLTLVTATPTWALPITDAAAACAERGGAWWQPSWSAGMCFSVRTSFTARTSFAARETFTPRETFEPRVGPPLTLTPPLVLPTAGAGGLSGAAPDPGSLQPTPEPATLLLVGTTAAGLGLARWRQRRRKQAARTP